MSQAILNQLNTIYSRLTAAEQANEALAARVTELERQNTSTDGPYSSGKPRLTLPQKAAGNGAG